jgi:DNA-binding beta-propeller fold protein YncE
MRDVGARNATNSVTAEWSRCPNEDFLLYILYRSDTPGITEDGPGISGLVSISDRDTLVFVDLDVQWASNYYYALLTLDSEGLGSWSNETFTMIPDIAPTPSTLTLDTTWLDRTTLSWTLCPDADFLEYRVYRSSEPEIAMHPDQAFTVGIFDDASDTTMVDSTFSWGTSYYALRTRNDLQAVSWSNEIEVTTEPPEIPWHVTEILDLGGFAGSTVIGWEGALVYSTDESTFRVFRTAVPAMTSCESPTPPTPTSLCLSADGAQLFVACDISGTLEVFTTQSLVPSGSLVLGGSPSCTVSAPTGPYIYCGCLQSHQVYAVRTTDLEVTAEAFPGYGPAGMACSPSGSRLYVSCRYDDAVSFLNSPQLELILSVDVGDGPGPVSVSTDGSRLYVACQPEGSVWVLSTVDGSVIHMMDQIGYPAGMAETPDGELLYVSDAEAGRVIVYETSTWQQIHVIDIGMDAGEIRCSPDGLWLVVAGGGEGTLVFIGL